MKDDKIRGRDSASTMAGKKSTKKTASSNLAPSKRKRKIRCSRVTKSFRRKSNSSTALSYIYDNTKSCRCGKRSSKTSLESCESETREKLKTTGSVFCGITPSDHNLIFGLSKTSIKDLLPSQYLTCFEHSSREFETPLDQLIRQFRAREEGIFPKHPNATVGLIKNDELNDCVRLDDSRDLKTEPLVAAIRQVIHNSEFEEKNDDLLQEDYLSVTEGNEISSLNLSKDADFPRVLNQLHSVKDDLLKARRKNRKLQEQLRRSVETAKQKTERQYNTRKYSPKLKSQLLKEQMRKFKEEVLRQQRENTELEELLQMKEESADKTSTLKYNFARHVKTMEDKLASERQRIREVKTIIGYSSSSSSSDCHFGKFNQSCSAKPNFYSKHKTKVLPEAGRNCKFKIKESHPTPFVENEEPMHTLGFLLRLNEYMDETPTEIPGLECQKKSHEQTEQKQIAPDDVKLDGESNESQMNLSSESEKPKENDLNTEDVHAIKKLLRLIASGVSFNQKKSSTTRNSPLPFEDRKEPARVNNIFTSLLAKIKSKKPKSNTKLEIIGDTPSIDPFKMMTSNLTQRKAKIRNEFQSEQRSSNSAGEKRGGYSHTHQEPKGPSLAAPDWVNQRDNVAEDTGTPQFNEMLKELAIPNQKLAKENQDLKTEVNQNAQEIQQNLLHQKLEAEVRNLQYQLEALASKDEEQLELEKQLEDVSSELHEKNEILENAKVQFTMQLTAMYEELGMAEDVLKQSLNSAEVLLEDMLKVKEKLTPLFPDIKWNNVNQVPKNSLSHLIKISRSLINDLADHLITMTKELTSNRKETEALKKENAKLLELAEESASKIKSLAEQAKCVETLKAQAEAVESQRTEATAKEGLLQKATDGVKRLEEEVLAKNLQIESLKLETQTFREHVDGLSQIILASGSGDAIRELASAKDQLSSLQTTYHQVLHERNSALEKLEQYDLEKVELEEHASKTNQLLGELEELRSKNLDMEEQLATQQSTLSALQNERVRHLEEKTFLNIMFSKLQAEFGRMEQLEGDLFTMNTEANRLALIAEYNKQLGEVLQHEVSERDAVIGELQKNLKALNDMQQENLQEKVALCQELSAACSMKDVLNSKLDEQIKKTEVQKSTTSKDLEAAKEMQSKERDAIKEIMTDFDALVCQRGELLDKQTKTTLKNESLRAKNKKMRIKITKANQLIYEKISVIMQLEHDVSEKEKEIQQLRLDLQGESAKYANELGKIKRVAKERETLEVSVEYLKKNVQKLQGDLNEAWENQRKSEDLLQLKTKEVERLKALNSEQNYKLLRAQEESGQLASQIDDLVHQCRNLEKQRDVLKGHIKNLEGSAEEQLEELKQELKIKAEKLAVSEENYESIEKLYDHLKRNYEEIAVENRNLKDQRLELIAEREIICNDSLKEEVQILSSKLEHIGACDLGERIGAALQSPVDDTPVEKSCHINLEEAHKELAQKLLRTAHLLIDEKLGRQEIENKLNDCILRLSEVEAEKFAEIQKNEAVVDELAKCKGKMVEMAEEGERVALMLDESKKMSLEIQAKYEQFEAQLADYKENYECLKERYNILVSEDNHHNGELLAAKERIDELKTELDCKHELVLNLQDEIAKLQQDVASTEFERRQINVQLHNANRELELQQELSRNLELMNKRALAAIGDMTEKGILQKSECETLLFVIHGSDE